MHTQFRETLPRMVQDNTELTQEFTEKHTDNLDFRIYSDVLEVFVCEESD